MSWWSKRPQGRTVGLLRAEIQYKNNRCKMATAMDPKSPVSISPLDMQTREAVTEGIVELLKPAMEEIDERVKTVRESQVELRSQIDSLAEDLKRISDSQAVPIDLEPYVKKLNNSRRRVMLINNILQNVQERLNKLYTNVSKETARRKTMLDPQNPGAVK